MLEKRWVTRGGDVGDVGVVASGYRRGGGGVALVEIYGKKR